MAAHRIIGQIEAIIWQDAAFYDETMNLDRVLSPQGFIQMTVGFVLPPQGDKLLRVVGEQSLTSRDWFKHLIIIPEGTVIRRIKLPMKIVREAWKLTCMSRGLPEFKS